MRPLLLLCILVGSSCATRSSLNPGLLKALAETMGPGEVRAYGGSRWAVPMAIGEMPIVVRRAAGFVLPDGIVAYAAEIWAPGEHSYLVEKLYGDADFRSVEVSSEGEILQRSHTLSAQDLPSRARDRLNGSLKLGDAAARLKLVRYEVFVGGAGGRPKGPIYRASFGIGGKEPSIYSSCDAEGQDLTQIRLRPTTLLVPNP